MASRFREMTSCPSGLRGQVQVLILICAGSNPVDVILLLLLLSKLLSKTRKHPLGILLVAKF